MRAWPSYTLDELLDMDGARFLFLVGVVLKKNLVEDEGYIPLGDGKTKPPLLGTTVDFAKMRKQNNG